MGQQTIYNIKGSVLIIGSVCDKISKLKEILSDNTYDNIIINGNICYPPNDVQSVSERIEEIKNINSNKVIYVSGRKDFEAIKLLNNDSISNWVLSNPNVVFLRFKNGSKIIVLDGGITPKMSLKDIQNSIEISFVSKINGIPWHRYYNGKFGYIISNRPESNNVNYYGYSAQIGTEHGSNKLFAVEANKFGIKKSITYEW